MVVPIISQVFRAFFVVEQQALQGDDDTVVTIKADLYPLPYAMLAVPCVASLV